MSKLIPAIYDLTKEEQEMTGGDKYVIFYAEGTKSKTFKTLPKARSFQKKLMRESK